MHRDGRGCTGIGKTGWGPRRPRSRKQSRPGLVKRKGLQVVAVQLPVHQTDARPLSDLHNPGDYPATKLTSFSLLSNHLLILSFPHFVRPFAMPYISSIVHMLSPIKTDQRDDEVGTLRTPALGRQGHSRWK